MIVEAHAVDHRLVVGQAEQARLGIAGLRARGDAADLDEAEALTQHGVGHFAILVEAGGQPDRIGKIEAPMAAGQQGVADRAPCRHEAGLEQAQRHAVRRLGRQQTQQRKSETGENDYAAF